MKKFFLSLIIIVAFTGYVFRQRFRGDDAQAVIAPNNLNTSASTNTPTQALTSNTSSGAAMPPSTTSNANTVSNSGSPKPMMQMGKYRNGTYTGPVTDAYYGNVQVRVTVKNGKIADVQFLQYPNDRETSIYINSQAMPYLKQEAIQAQSANINIVSGATATSEAFIQSLRGALSQA